MQAKGDTNATNNDGVTPLLKAAQKGHTEIVTALLAAKADVNAANKTDGVTPLYMAAAKGHTEIVTTLLEANADVNTTKDFDNWF